MSNMPSVRPEDVARVARRLGFELDRQKGSHAVYLRPSDRRRVVIPMHRRDLKKGLLYGLISDLGISKEEFKTLV